MSFINTATYILKIVMQEDLVYVRRLPSVSTMRIYAKSTLV